MQSNTDKPETKLSFAEFVRLYVGEELTPHARAICDFLEKNETAKLVLEGHGMFPGHYRPSTLNDPAPWSFGPPLEHAWIPAGVWAEQGRTHALADSVGAAHSNSMIFQQYREWYYELHKRGIPDSWMKEIFAIAHEYKMDVHEVASMVGMARGMPNGNTPKGVIVVDDPARRPFQYQKDMFDNLRKMNKIDAAAFKVRRRKEADKKFSKQIEEKFRLANEERRKQGKKRRKR